MSLAQELNELGEFRYIKLTDLTIGQKYKVHALKPYNSLLGSTGRVALRVDIDNGYLVMPERYDAKVDTIHESNVENLYVIYNGKIGNRTEIKFTEEKALKNEILIHFFYCCFTKKENEFSNGISRRI